MVFQKESDGTKIKVHLNELLETIIMIDLRTWKETNPQTDPSW